MARHGVAVIEMTAFTRVKRGRSTRIPPNLRASVRVDALDCAELPIRHPTFSIWRGHLYAVACGKRAFGFAIQCHALQASWVIAQGAVVICPDGDLIGLCVEIG